MASHSDKSKKKLVYDTPTSEPLNSDSEDSGKHSSRNRSRERSSSRTHREEKHGRGEKRKVSESGSDQLERVSEKPEDFNMKLPSPKKRVVIGPQMPSADDAEEIDGVLIGPPPPAVVKESESANEAERFEEVTRIIMGAHSPYDVVGVNRNMSADNIKKKYWKLSLMVHPDKCAHPQANQAFIVLNKAFNDLQDSDKRKAMDDKLIYKEEQEKIKAKMKELRKAAQLQGISMECDEVRVERKRDEWMTTLPATKEAWKKAAKTNMDAEMVDRYNKANRSKSLVEEYKETASKRSRKKSKDEWEGQHPWKPWDRENDLKAGRKNIVKLDAENMSQAALSSRFSSSSLQRNFL